MRIPSVRTLGWSALAVALPLGLTALLAGCGDTPCEQLADACEHCTDQTYRDACNSMVARNNYDVCDAQEPTFVAACPEVQ
jgi:hypothetical protein